MNDKFRCHCPITSALDILGDKWTLVIVKQMLIEGKQAFKDFSESDEAIASNILSARLKMLEEFKIITKDKLPHNKKANIYRLTDKGIALAPVIVELGVWSDAYMRDFHPEIIKGEHMEVIKNNKEAFIVSLQKNYEKEVSSEQSYPKLK
tara:strand:- start:1095 stop:1544 length:450 start_codon:yes stop_codon:yes gene_type:complete